MLIALAKEIASLRFHSYDDAERAFNQGIISERQWRVYCLFWQWTCGRLSEPWNSRQYSYAKRCGWQSLFARFDRFKAAWDHGTRPSC